MFNYKLEIEYDGSNYCGWQVQNQCKVKTIQEAIEKTLEKILREKIKLIGSGRTDAGVHALCQVANFKTNAKISLKKLQRALNSLLPDDIAITGIEEVNLNFHSRFDAKSKIYRYLILNRGCPSPFLRNRVYFYPYPLDIKLMRQEAQYLLGKHDFKAFCAAGSNTKDTIRTIKYITIKKASYELKKSPLITIEIEAAGFLYNMVRNIIGTLIEIGRGRLKKGELKKILLAKDRRFAGPTAVARGLCLRKVNYK